MEFQRGAVFWLWQLRKWRIEWRLPQKKGGTSFPRGMLRLAFPGPFPIYLCSCFCDVPVMSDESLLKSSSYQFELPRELIAQRPPEKRGDSRLMVVDRTAGTIRHRKFSELSDFLRSNDLLVFNDTRVIPARFFSNDGKKELLRLETVTPTRWKCLVRPGKRLRPGHKIEIGPSTGKVMEICGERGLRLIEFDQPPDEKKHGHLALPPYIERADEASDHERYQTVYAREAGAIAAPTAGLHFSRDDLVKFSHTFVTLHVGMGTFRPVSSENIFEHTMHSEAYTLGPECARKINQSSGRIVAVGTTVVRVLESCFAADGAPLAARSGDTDIFIYPPYSFGVVDCLLTNFHLPKSTLLMLVSAFAGRDVVMEAYAEAVKNKYRFFSFGDCMLII